MKTSLFVLIALPLQLLAAESTEPMLKAEIQKVQGEFQNSYLEAKKSLNELKTDEKRAIEAAKKQSQQDSEGLDAFRRYDLLVQTRYVNEAGQYQSAMEVSQKDLVNLNRLFETYLRATPLVGRVSAGHARKMIDWGIDRLQELSQMNAKPTKKNNPELEIITQQIEDAEKKLKTVTDLAQKLGVPLSDRAPASAP